MASMWVMNSLCRASLAKMVRSCQYNARTASMMAPPFIVSIMWLREKRK